MAKKQPRFNINGKEYELKLTYQAVSYLNGLYEGGAIQVVGQALMGNTSLFEHVVHAGLFHAGENFSLDTIKEAIELEFDAGNVTFDSTREVLKEVIANSFFYKKMAKRLQDMSPELKESMKMLEG